MIRNLIFDIGNVLAKFGWEDYLRSYNFEPEKETAIAKALFLGPYWKEFDRGALSLDELRSCFVSLAPQYREDVLTVFEHCDQCMSGYDYPIPWLQDLKSRGLHLYYLSNYSEIMLKHTTEALKFLPLMEGGLFSYEVKQVKPDQEIFYSLMKRYPQIRPEESVFFDDSAANVEAARKLGFHGIQFCSKAQAEKSLEALLNSAQ